MGTIESLLDEHVGDLNNLVGKFEASGLGDKVKSWIGTGPNESIGADDIKRALGPKVGEIAAKLFISDTTVKTHVNHLLVKTGMRDRAQLVAYAYRLGLAR